jgi:hypothetical protein
MVTTNPMLRAASAIAVADTSRTVKAMMAARWPF